MWVIDADYLTKERKIKRIGVVGYSQCAKYVLEFLGSNDIRAVFIAHPKKDDDKLDTTHGPLRIVFLGRRCE
jgi:dienelactone hydrolase